MECYICNKPVKVYNYRRHVHSHLVGNGVGVPPRPDATLPTFSYDTVDYDHHGTVFPARSTPPHLRARIPLEHDHILRSATQDDHPQSGDPEDFVPADNYRTTHFTPSRSSVRPTVVPNLTPQQEMPRGQSTEPNAFQLWLKNPTDHSAKYTTIDGQTSKSDLHIHEFIQAAQVLRGTTKEDIIKIVKEFEGLNFSCDDKKTCLELIRKAPIFPGLVAYTYTHLIACPRRRWFSSNDDWSDRVSELKQLVECWAKYSDAECILSYDTIKNRLLEILRVTEIRSEEHECNSALLNGTMVLNYDILNLAALAALCITGPQKTDVLDGRGAQAEKLVELFHGLLEANVELDELHRRHFLDTLFLLSKESGYCPRGIYLAEGAIHGLVSFSQGGFGFVYKGSIGTRLVAVKALKRDGRISLPEYNKQLSKEAIVWKHLRHPNCLPLYGTYIMPTEGPYISVALVSPWMDQGTLSGYLEHNPSANRTQLILDVVRGLNYLHSMKPHVAHRDIKPDNILITTKGRACLADFGLVSTFDADFHTATSNLVMGGTYSYMAPEIFTAKTKEKKRNVNKRACDMYALGGTIYAAYTGKRPFHEISPERIRLNVISGQRPEFPEGRIPLDMWSFVENLWGSDPLKRLTAEQALGWMEFVAYQEGVDLRPAPFDEEWEWKGPRDGKCLWSVSS